MSLLGPLFRWDAVDALLGDAARLQCMLDFEAALARAEAKTGVIPASAAQAIAACCHAERFNVVEIGGAAATAGNVAIPLVKKLTAMVGERDKEAARFVHWGATSQDAIDTGFVLQLRSAFTQVDAELGRMGDGLAELARKHRGTVMAARTWMQQALPTTFGLKAAGWLDAIDRQRDHLSALRPEALVLQFGGAAGTLAALGGKGMEVARALGDELELDVPTIPWHGHRDRMAAVATAFALVAGTLGKIARDIALMAQTEVAEAFEPAATGRGGSSTLPHKRNPVACAVALAAATRVPGLASTMLGAMVQENERGLGGWQAEWETLPEIISLTAGALHALANAVAGLEIDAAKMAENLELTHGLIFSEAVQMALGGALGRLEAHELVQAASQRARAEGRHLRDILGEDPAVTRHVSAAELARLFEPGQYLGSAQALIDGVLRAHEAVSGTTPREATGKGR
jgi:3-carboxy-cis,cis-muconate cycloisomerase